MTLARFLAEVRMRNGTPIPADIDPIGVILARVGMHPHSIESRTLSKACLAVIAREGEFIDSDVFALGRDARGLLDAFAVERLTARYRQQDSDIIATNLREVQRGLGNVIRSSGELRRPRLFLRIDRDGKCAYGPGGLCMAR